MTSRTLKNILFLSMAVNLLLAAVVTTRWWTPLWHEPRRGPDAIVERLAAPLPTKDADILRANFQANQAKLATLMAELQQARRDAHDKLVAEPFDLAAFSNAVATLRTKRQAFDLAIQNTVLEVVPSFSPEGRKRLWRGGHGER